MNSTSPTTPNILGVREVLRIGALPLERHRSLTKTVRGQKEQAPQQREALDRIVGAVVRAMTISPFVVAWNVNQRARELIEQRQTVVKHVIAADRAAVLDISVMGDEGQTVIGVDVGDHVRELRIAFRWKS